MKNVAERRVARLAAQDAARRARRRQLVERLRRSVINRTDQSQRRKCRDNRCALAKAHRFSPYFISAATWAWTILSGLAGGSPFLSLSTTSMPRTTSPTTVYLPLRNEPSANMMKNWLLAEFGSDVRAMPTMPRV